MDRASVSRRRLVASAALMGGSLGAAVSGAAASGAELDLTNAADQVSILARLNGNVEPGRSRFDWFDGTVSLVSASGDIRPLCGIRGYSETHIAPSADGGGSRTAQTWMGQASMGQAWMGRRKVIGIYTELDRGTDLHSGTVARTIQNPLTGAWVEPRGFTAETQFEISARLPHLQAPHVQWRVDGAAVLVDETATAAALPWPGRAKTTRSVSMADIQDHNLTTLRDTGTWRVVTSWMPWLQMGQALGHCLIDCLRGGGALTMAELPAAIVKAFEDPPMA